MSDPEQLGAEPASVPQPAPGETRASLTNPTLTASLSADLEALRNDVQQANEMAADFQRQLAGKSNDYALMKQIFDQTQRDIVQLQAGITELRQERHRLANEAIRAVAFEMKLKAMTAERDQLRAELDAARKENAASDRQAKNSDAMIARLAARVESLSEQLAAARRTPGAPPAPLYDDPELRSVVRIISENVAQLKEIIDPAAAGSGLRGGSDSGEVDVEFIDVGFDK